MIKKKLELMRQNIEAINLIRKDRRAAILAYKISKGLCKKCLKSQFDTLDQYCEKCQKNCGSEILELQQRLG